MPYVEFKLPPPPRPRTTARRGLARVELNPPAGPHWPGGPALKRTISVRFRDRAGPCCGSPSSPITPPSSSPRSPRRPSACSARPSSPSSAGLEVTTVAKLLKPLAQAGLVAGFRGAHGGYRLARDARAISLIEIVEAMEGPLGMTECSVHAGACGIESSCGVRANWRRINDVVADALRGVTLADMLRPPPQPPAQGAPRIPATLATA
jgi:FeS assembly SUF system regulator